MGIKIQINLFIACWWLPVTLWALPAAQPENVTQTVKIDTNDAATLYRENCAICHGDNGDANTRAISGLRPPPRNFTTVEAALELTRERMIKSVTYGRPGTGMMPHKDRLSTQQIEALVDYIRSTFMLSPDSKNPVVTNIRGAKIFTKNCAVCHGDKGNTAIWAKNGLNPPPRDFTTAEASRILTRERMLNSVTNGRKGTGMMPFSSRLSKEDIEAVVDYIREAFLKAEQVKEPAQQAAEAVMPADAQHAGAAMHGGPHDQGVSAVPDAGLPPVVAADMALPMPKQLVGSRKAGQDFFMLNCFTCHGKEGRGDGPRAYFNIPRPRNFTSPESRQMLNKVRLFYGIKAGRVGTVMPAWGKVLSDQQIADVAEFVFQEFIQPNKKPPQTKSKKKAQ